VFGVGRFCPPASTSKARRSLSTKEQGCRRFVCTPALTYFPYLQPEQEAQQSAEEQQPACAALAALVTPSAITAINNTTFSVFIVFSFRSGKSLGERTKPSARKNFVGCRTSF
jgi:hypothetical protein